VEVSVVLTILAVRMTEGLEILVPEWASISEGLTPEPEMMGRILIIVLGSGSIIVGNIHKVVGVQ
jgi:hypothetical protein